MRKEEKLKKKEKAKTDSIHLNAEFQRIAWKRQERLPQ